MPHSLYLGEAHLICKIGIKQSASSTNAYAETAPFNVKNEASFNVLNNNVISSLIMYSSVNVLVRDQKYMTYEAFYSIYLAENLRHVTM